VVQEISSDLRTLHDIQSPAMELARFIVSDGPSGRGEKLQASQEFNTILRRATGIAKAPYVADFVRMIVETGEKVVLFGWHHAVYDIWMERLKDLHPRLFTGTESGKQKQDAVDDFTNGDCKVLIMSLRSGVGLDGLQYVCRIGVFGELDWSPKVHGQCGGRIDRPGQAKPVLLYFLTAVDGSDPVVLDVLGIKQDQSDGILDPDDTDEHGYLDSKGENVRKLAEAYLAKHSAGIHHGNVL
jgi:SNF2 family DNA or RNA helicase